MRKSYINGLIVIIFSAVLAASCERVETPLEEGVTDELIRVEAQGSDMQTRGLLNSTDLKKAGTTVKVYDYLTGFTGIINGQQYDGTATGGNVMYIDDAVKLGTDGGEDWKFDSFDWRWTRTGTHNFYGWLTHDANGGGMDIPSGWSDFNPGSKTLTVGPMPITMNADTPQFDFSYSEIKSVDVESDKFDPNASISLKLSHLFSALSVTVINRSPDNAYIKEITLTGFNNKRSATITFDTERQKTAVNYGTGSYEAFFPNWPAASTVDVNYGHSVPKATSSPSGTVPTRYDLIRAKSMGADEEYDHILMWPQLASESEFSSAQINVKYYIEGVYDLENETNPTALKLQEKTFNLKEVTGLNSLDAGYKYALNLEFKDKTINLTLVPLPWKMVYEDLDYSTNTILPNSNKDNDGVLWLYYLEGNTWKAGDRNRLITMKNNSDIQGRFYILAPTSGQWQITTYPAEAAQYFTVEPSSGAIEDLVDGEGNFLGEVKFLVKANGVVPATQTIHFNVDIMLNGQWRNANTEFNRKDWQLTREP